jgi:hypothetical protein
VVERLEKPGALATQLEVDAVTLAGHLGSEQTQTAEAVGHDEGMLDTLSLAVVRDSQMHCCKTWHSSYPRKAAVGQDHISPESGELLGCLFHRDRTLDVSWLLVLPVNRSVRQQLHLTP